MPTKKTTEITCCETDTAPADDYQAKYDTLVQAVKELLAEGPDTFRGRQKHFALAQLVAGE